MEPSGANALSSQHAQSSSRAGTSMMANMQRSSLCKASKLSKMSSPNSDTRLDTAHTHSLAVTGTLRNELTADCSVSEAKKGQKGSFPSSVNKAGHSSQSHACRRTYSLPSARR